MSGIFSGCRIVITGASSGLGRAIAINLGQAGADLTLVGRTTSELEVTADMVREDPNAGTCDCVTLDVAQSGGLAAVIEKISASDEYLFAVINNAGLMYPEPVVRGTMERWRAMVDVNLLAPLEACQAAIIAMRAHGRPGHLINIGSVAGRWEVGGVYGATKAALEIVGRSLREELEQDDIRISTVIPGGFATQLSRGVLDEEKATIARNAARKGASNLRSKRVADPVYLARVVRFILEQPIDINIADITVRPPISIQV